MYLFPLQIHIFTGYSGRSLLWTYGYEIVNKGRFDLPFTLISELGDSDISAVEEKLSFRSKSDNIVLLQFIEFQEHFVVIITSVHDKGYLFKERCPTLHSRKHNIVYQGKKLFFGRMDFQEKADGMVVFCKDIGLCHMIAFFINGFRGRNFRTIPDKTERLKFQPSGLVTSLSSIWITG